ncbi:4964_t:CDS:2, partial [Funneliformis mosseae]
ELFQVFSERDSWRMSTIALFGDTIRAVRRAVRRAYILVHVEEGQFLSVRDPINEPSV